MKRILVIEDDPAVRGLIVETLSMRGWQPLDAPNGKVGVDLAARELPDLILCDIQMPEKDGFQVLRELRGTLATATIPFVFLTGLTEKPDMRQAMELGADDYIVKPFTVKELIAAVEARFQKQDLLAKSSDQKMEELRGSLTFALPHELVTPLNSILGFSSLILESPATAEVKEYAELIRAAGDRLKSLIEKFLLYARIEMIAADPQQRLAATNHHPLETSDTIIAAAERAATEVRRQADLRLEVAPVEHRIDASHLARLVRELIENAFKFSEPGTTVELRSHRRDDAFVLEAIDRGRGFSTEQIRKVGAHLQFDRKLQEQQGTGLGLAICRRIAEIYGGALKITSMPSELTRVTVSLPDQAPAAE
jgi:two-component system sensor histidine kinase/response regulator